MSIDFDPRANFSAELIGPLPVRLVNHEHICYFHDAGLHTLDRISKAGHQNKTGCVGNADYVDLILSDAYGLYYDQVLSEGIQDLYNVCGGFGRASEKSPSGHAPDIYIRIVGEFAHSDPVAQQGAPGEGT